jgi:type III restriction enzyme
MVKLAGSWQERFQAHDFAADPRPPVLIIVCKNTAIAKMIHAWVAENECPDGVGKFGIPELLNKDGAAVTIRCDSKVVQDTDSDSAKNDDVKWMRHTLDTVGRQSWPINPVDGKPVFPEGFEDLAKKLERPLHPPGRDIRCIVSVGMLTEGWDCQTVTHIIGLRPFMSQLLCEQVVGRGLRRLSYVADDEGKFSEEVAEVLGVPFELTACKATQGGGTKAQDNKKTVRATDGRAKYAIRFPVVERYSQVIRSRLTVDWDSIPTVSIDPMKLPDKVMLRGLAQTTGGKIANLAPGLETELTNEPWRMSERLQTRHFGIAHSLCKRIEEHCSIPLPQLFPQVLEIVRRYVEEKVQVFGECQKDDVFVSDYYRIMWETLSESIKGDTSAGESPEVPVYDGYRPVRSTHDVLFGSSKDLRECVKTHINYVVNDTKFWEQHAAVRIDTHPGVLAFVKNDHLGFEVPYLFRGERRTYLPDFILRLAMGDTLDDTDQAKHCYLILEVKGQNRDETETKHHAAQRWVKAVNADGRWGFWQFDTSYEPSNIPSKIAAAVSQAKKRTEHALAG